VGFLFISGGDRNYTHSLVTSFSLFFSNRKVVLFLFFILFYLFLNFDVKGL
jgi:hypothetical protein